MRNDIGSVHSEEAPGLGCAQRDSLQGSAGVRGEPNYTHSIEQNLFDQILLPSVRASFERGAGGELRGSIPTMSALHSSAAMAVNLFQYWVRNGDLAGLAGLLEIPSLDVASADFEDCFPVCEDPQRHGFNEPPHLDFAFRFQDGSRAGIECKLFEPYGRLEHAPLRRPYLNLTDAWSDIPACRTLAEQLATGSAGFHRLGASQLLKHILGLRFGAATAKARLSTCTAMRSGTRLPSTGRRFVGSESISNRIRFASFQYPSGIYPSRRDSGARKLLGVR